jgi:hypothetical protein
MRQDDADAAVAVVHFYLLHHLTIRSRKGIRKLVGGFESVFFFFFDAKKEQALRSGSKE